jgi:ribosome-associated protein
VRIKTKPSRGAREERIKAKTVRGKVKKLRRGKVELE